MPIYAPDRILSGMSKKVLKLIAGKLMCAPVAALALLFACSCLEESGKGGESAGASKPLIVTTIPPLAMLLREIAAGEYDVECLLQPGASPHTYEPSPSAAKKAESAAALFYVGQGLDDWAAKLGAKRKVAVFDLLPDEIKLKFGGGVFFEAGGGEKPGDVHGDEHGHDHSHSHDEGEFDPHFWTSPRAAIAASVEIAGELINFDPENREAIQQNLRAFEIRLHALDVEIREKLAPHAGENVVLVHPSLNYFMHDYGIKLAGVIETTAGAEPSPRRVAELAQIVKDKNVAALFTEPQLSKSAAEAIAREAGVGVYELDPLGGSPGRETYQELIRFNTDAFLKAFDGASG